MRYLECPYCKQKAAKEWEILIGLSAFWRYKRCRYCLNKIRINIETLYLMVVFFVGAVILSYILHRVLPIPYLIIKLFVLLSFLYPLLSGKKLFAPEETLKNDN